MNSVRKDEEMYARMAAEREKRYEDEEKRGPRRRGFMTRTELQNRGLFCGCDYWVDMAAFKVRHPVELPDGRRFVTWEAAFSGLKR